jgi:hypothetical protein
LLSSVRRANSCPEIKKTNGSSISSGTSPLQEETEEDHGDDINISNGHTREVPVSLLTFLLFILIKFIKKHTFFYFIFL